MQKNGTGIAQIWLNTNVLQANRNNITNGQLIQKAHGTQYAKAHPKQTLATEHTQTTMLKQ